MIWSGAVSKDAIMSKVSDVNYLINCTTSTAWELYTSSSDQNTAYIHVITFKMNSK